MRTETVIKTLPAGTVVKINGIPVTLSNDAEIRTTDANYRLLVIQDEQSVGMPAQANLGA